MNTKKVASNKLTVIAFNLFRECGYHGTSIQDIANEAHITKATIYYYFKSKEEILIDTLQYAIANWEIEDLTEDNEYVNFIIKMRFEMSHNRKMMKKHIWPKVYEIAELLKENKETQWAIRIITGSKHYD